MSWSSSISKVNGYGLNDPGLISGRGNICFLRHHSRTCYGPAHPRIQSASGARSQLVKEPEREADHLPPSSAEVKMRAVLRHRDNFIFTCRDSSVGIATGYGLDDRCSRVRFPRGAGNFSLHHRVQNGSGAQPAFYPMGTGGSFPGSKAARA
jgi:hypothetical protein